MLWCFTAKTILLAFISFTSYIPCIITDFTMTSYSIRSLRLFPLHSYRNVESSEPLGSEYCTSGIQSLHFLPLQSPISHGSTKPITSVIVWDEGFVLLYPRMPLCAGMSVNPEHLLDKEVMIARTAISTNGPQFPRTDPWSDPGRKSVQWLLLKQCTWYVAIFKKGKLIESCLPRVFHVLVQHTRSPPQRRFISVPTTPGFPNWEMYFH